MTLRASIRLTVAIAGFLAGWLYGRNDVGTSRPVDAAVHSPSDVGNARSASDRESWDERLSEALRICRSFPGGVFAGDGIAALDKLLASLAVEWTTETHLSQLGARDLCWTTGPLETLAGQLESRAGFETLRRTLLAWSSQVSAEELYLSLSKEIQWKLVRSGQVVPAIFGRRSRTIVDSFPGISDDRLPPSDLLAIRLSNRAAGRSPSLTDDPMGAALEKSRSELVALMKMLTESERRDLLESLSAGRNFPDDNAELWFDAVLTAFPPDECIGFVKAAIRREPPARCLMKFGEAIARSDDPEGSLARALSAWETQSPRREIVMGFSSVEGSGYSGDPTAMADALIDDPQQRENLRASAADSLVRRNGPAVLAELDLPIDRKTDIAFRAAGGQWAGNLLELALDGALDPAQALRWFENRPDLVRQLAPGSLDRLRQSMPAQQVSD